MEYNDNAKKFKNFFKELRYYKNTLPNKDDLVLATITKYTDVGIFCFLDEYKKEAFMSFKDASSSRKLRVIRKEVLKNKKYILTVIKVDNDKNFIDVEKRSISEKDDVEMTNLINFYQRIFSIFIKTYIINNPECNINDVYTFLNNSLWLDNISNIKNNLYNIHTDPISVIDKYNLNNDIGKKILEELQLNLEKPIYVHKISLKINSISLKAIEDIKEFLNMCETTLNCKFISKSAPFYYTKIKKNYLNEDKTKFNEQNYNELLKTQLTNIKSTLKKDLFVDIVNIESKYILNY